MCTCLTQRQTDKAVVAKVVGVDRMHVEGKARGVIRIPQPHKDRVAQRFFAAHVLLDVIGEVKSNSAHKPGQSSG